MLRRERPPQSVTAVEIAPDAVELMRQTAEISSLTHFAPLRGDLREIRTLLPAHSFRLVTCNPPYFPAGSGYLCPEDSRRGPATNRRKAAPPGRYVTPLPGCCNTGDAFACASVRNA